MSNFQVTLQWCHNEHDAVSNHRHPDCLLNRLLRDKKTSKLQVTGLCEGNPPMTGGFPLQRASNVENVYIWWHHHAFLWLCCRVKVQHHTVSFTEWMELCLTDVDKPLVLNKQWATLNMANCMPKFERHNFALASIFFLLLLIHFQIFFSFQIQGLKKRFYFNIQFDILILSPKLFAHRLRAELS